ncbi:MAG: MaoC/PaaZ C-terminal domain-containing protein [Pseudomonadota bacterium]
MSPVDLSVIGRQTEPRWFEYTFKDVALYALGVGASTAELPYIYENTPGGIRVLPTYAVIPAMFAYPPLGDIDLSRFLHGEQGIRLFRPLPPQGKIMIVGEVTDIWDKGKAAVYNIKVVGRDEAGRELFEAVFTNFYLGAGGFGGNPGPKAVPAAPPEGQAPDFSIPYRVAENQAALYRLNGDLNPLHIDPDFARRGGQEQPILHGLCTFGIAGRNIVNAVLGGDPTRLKSFKARFTSVVYLGDALTTDIWKKDEKNLIVQVRTERGVVLGAAQAEID